VEAEAVKEVKFLKKRKHFYERSGSELESVRLFEELEVKTIKI